MTNSLLIYSSIVLALAAVITGCVIAPAPHQYRADVVYPDAVPQGDRAWTICQ